MPRTYRKSRQARYAAPRRAHPLRSVGAGVVGTFTALAIIGACSEGDQDTQPAAEVELVELQESSSGIPLPTEINVGRDEGIRTVTILADGYDGNDAGRRIMTQADFPCNEDEALIYHPSFGPDHVGCMNREDVE